MYQWETALSEHSMPMYHEESVEDLDMKFPSAWNLYLFQLVRKNRDKFRTLNGKDADDVVHLNVANFP